MYDIQVISHCFKTLYMNDVNVTLEVTLYVVCIDYEIISATLVL